MPDQWRALTPNEFTSLFHDGWENAFRLEQLQDYSADVEGAALARFQAGGSPPMGWHQPWLAMVQGVRDAGRTMTRVRRVQEPWTDYTAFELQHVYPLSVAAGEEVLVHLSQDPLPPGHDFWLLDGLVARMTYDGPTWVQADLTDDESTVSRYEAWAEAASAAATPVLTYLATRSDRERRTA